MKKITIIIFIFLLTGCTSYTELNDLAIIKSIGIEYKDKEYILYAEIIDKINQDNLPETKVINVKNKNIQELFSDIKLLVNKEIYLSHIDLIIISETLNNNNFEEIINFFLNNKEIRNDFLCIYATDIEKVLKESDYDEIEEIVSTNKDSKDIINVTFEEIIKDFLDKKKFKVSLFTYDSEIRFIGNILYNDNEIERINSNEKEENRE